MPCDPVSGIEWWKLNLHMIVFITGWAEFQSGKTMDQLIPVIRCLIHGFVNKGEMT